MEHRCSVRKPSRFPVMLYRHGLPVCAGRCRDLALGGAFIEAAGYPWRKNEFLELEILGTGATPSIRVPAVVVHFSQRGAGFSFEAVGREALHRLRKLLAAMDASHEAVEDTSRAVA